MMNILTAELLRRDSNELLSQRSGKLNRANGSWLDGSDPVYKIDRLPKFKNPTNGRDCAKRQIPPGFSRWYLSFDLEVLQSGNLLDTSDFSRVVFQFRPTATVQS